MNKSCKVACKQMCQNILVSCKPEIRSAIWQRAACLGDDATAFKTLVVVDGLIMPSGFICWSCYETKVFKYSENSPIRVLTPGLRAARRSIPNFCSKMKCLNTTQCPYSDQNWQLVLLHEFFERAQGGWAVRWP